MEGLSLLQPDATEKTDEAASAGSLRELLRVATPLVLSSGSTSLMLVVDRMFLTWYSTDALAAAMPAGILHWTLLSLPFGMGSYVNAFVAQYEGARRKDRVAAAVWQGVYLAVIAGLLLALLSPFSAQIFRLAGHGGTVEKLEAEYFSILSAGSVAMLLFTTLGSFFSGRGQTMVILWVSLVSSAVNAVLDYALIFGWGPFPEMGMREAALATVAGNVAGVLLYVILMARPAVTAEYVLWSRRGYDGELFRRLTRYGFPNGLLMLIDVGAFALFVFLVGRLGEAELAATTLAFTLNAMAFIPMIGLSIAVSTLVGMRIGEGRPELAIRTTWNAFGLAAAYMIAFAAIYLGMPNLILRPFAARMEPGEFQRIEELVVVLLRFVAMYCFFDAMAIVFGSAIRGAGDTRFSMIVTLFGGLAILLLPTWLTYHYWGGSLIASWWACTAYVVFLGFVFLFRFQAGHWRSMSVIEHVAPDVA